jgi:zinc-binding in reverse transcriptase
MDIRLHNQCLLLRWVWVAIKEPDSLWGSTLTSLGTVFTPEGTAISQNTNQSHFIKSLNNLSPMLQASLTMDPHGTVLWKWTPNQLFSAISIYKICNNPGIPRPQFRQLWKTHAPPRVLFFLWLLLHDKLNTVENLQKNLCSGVATESTDHLFSTCPMTTSILLSTTTATPQLSATDTCSSLVNNRERQRWTSAIWIIWKERNA